MKDYVFYSDMIWYDTINIHNVLLHFFCNYNYCDAVITTDMEFHNVTTNCIHCLFHSELTFFFLADCWYS